MSEKKSENVPPDFTSESFSDDGCREQVVTRLRERVERFYEEASIEQLIEATLLIRSLLAARGLLREQHRNGFSDLDLILVQAFPDSSPPAATSIFLLRLFHLSWPMQRTLISARTEVASAPLNSFESFVLHRSPPFQALSVGLGFRVIPALGAYARQFQPWRVSVSFPDCRLRLFRKHKQSAPDPPKNCCRLP